MCLSIQGMDIIETLNPAMFTEYLKKYNNTICGRHPIGVLLQVKKVEIKSLLLLDSFQCELNLLIILLSTFAGNSQP